MPPSRKVYIPSFGQLAQSQEATTSISIATDTSPSTSQSNEPRDQRHIESHRSQSFLQLWRCTGTGHQEAIASDELPNMLQPCIQATVNTIDAARTQQPVQLETSSQGESLCMSGGSTCRPRALSSAPRHGQSLERPVLSLIHGLPKTRPFLEIRNTACSIGRGNRETSSMSCAIFENIHL
ncbi:hypothetical protein M440DRAFT_1173651 [Trichoderma longibrachiatum ATCC 18648]|uniref:Uncharacterized protein n=1 Tax=Trichoderma longibrachiatum ATCC 18648 TaxID=983965 RepID=A0A2T4CDH7_TRILO|nr:hypothetical protein M440DRAFT_1173651 [Trichoderma longibrachiatum ATCC 18648]